MELMEVVSGKLHGIRVTESNLNYHGSITIDEEILRAANFLPMEFVYVWNKNSGSRISTYILPAKAGSGVVCLNGAAARSCQKGDEVIITSSRNISADDIGKRSARVLTFKHDKKINEIDEVIEYKLEVKNGDWKFEIENIEKY